MFRVALSTLIVLLALALAGGCGEDTIVDPPPPELPDPIYYSVESGPPGNGFLVGWTRGPTGADARASGTSATFLPGHPWHQWLAHERSGTALTWELGPGEAGPFRRGYSGSFGFGYGYAIAGWGDLLLDTALVPGLLPEPLPLSAQSPLGFAELGERWNAAGRPATLDLDVLLFPAPEDAPLLLEAALIYNGQVDEGFSLESFQLELGGDIAFFKLYAEHFPVPRAIYWESSSTFIQVWGDGAEPPPIGDWAFAPTWPQPEGYTVGELEISAPGGALPATRLRPDGDGPFPALLLVPDDALADRNDAAAFGHLAHACAREGWLVLRYDKPGTGASTAGPDSLDLGTRRGAIAAAWQTLREDADVQAMRTVLLGHGEGAALALEFAAGEATVAGTIGLSPLYYDPAKLPSIPEAEAAPGDWVLTPGGTLFVGKHKDLLLFDSADYLSAASWAGRHVLLARAEADTRLSAADLLLQETVLGAAGALVSVASYAEVNRFLTTGRPDDATDAALVAGVLDWLADYALDSEF